MLIFGETLTEFDMTPPYELRLKLIHNAISKIIEEASTEASPFDSNGYKSTDINGLNSADISTKLTKTAACNVLNMNHSGLSKRELLAHTDDNQNAQCLKVNIVGKDFKYFAPGSLTIAVARYLFLLLTVWCRYKHQPFVISQVGSHVQIRVP